MSFFEKHKDWHIEGVKKDSDERLGPLLEHVTKLTSSSLELSEVDVSFDLEGDAFVVKADGSISLKFTRKQTS